MTNDLCQCQKCGRMHKPRQAGTPPESIRMTETERLFIEIHRLWEDGGPLDAFDLQEAMERCGLVVCEKIAEPLEDDVMRLTEVGAEIMQRADIDEPLLSLPSTSEAYAVPCPKCKAAAGDDCTSLVIGCSLENNVHAERLPAGSVPF